MPTKRFASAIALFFALSVQAAAQVPNLRQPGPTLGPLPAEVPITQFATGEARCDTGARTARVVLNAILQPLSSQVSGATARVDILLDGVSVGARTLPVRRSTTTAAVVPATIQVSRDLNVPWSNGTKRVQFVVNNTHRSAERTFTYNCYRVQLPPHQAPTGQVQLPDLAIDPIVIIYYNPPRPDYDPCHGAGRNLFGDCRLLTDYGNRTGTELPQGAIIQTDFSGVVPIYRLTSEPCPTAVDASVTVTVAIAFTANSMVARQDGWGLQQGMIEEGFFGFRYQSDVREFRPGIAYLDSRHTTPQARAGYQNYPVGHEWATFHRTLPCTNEGVFEFALDPHNRLREQDETNNVLRFRYRTAAP